MVGIHCKQCGWVHDDYDCTPATDRPVVAEQQGGENAKIARARRALERIRNVGRDRSEKLWYRVDDMVDEAVDALRFLAS